MSGKKTELRLGNMPIVRCECGVELLLIPDLAEMGKVVEEHAKTHKNGGNKPEEAEREFGRIQDLLIGRIFLKISQIS